VEGVLDRSLSGVATNLGIALAASGYRFPENPDPEHQPLVDAVCAARAVDKATRAKTPHVVNHMHVAGRDEDSCA
jgi:hypothetical protein